MTLMARLVHALHIVLSGVVTGMGMMILTGAVLVILVIILAAALLIGADKLTQRLGLGG